VGQALVWQEKSAKSLQTAFVLAWPFILQRARGRDLLLSGGVAARLPDLQPLDLSGGQLRFWSDSVIRETREARRATPAQIHDRSRLVIARAAVARLLPTNWILEDHSSRRRGGNGAATSWCASLRLSHRGAILHMRCHSCCTRGWLSAIIILAESCLYGRWI